MLLWDSVCQLGRWNTCVPATIEQFSIEIDCDVVAKRSNLLPRFYPDFNPKTGQEGAHRGHIYIYRPTSLGSKALKIIYKLSPNFLEPFSLYFSFSTVPIYSSLKTFPGTSPLSFKTALCEFEDLRARFPIDAAFFQDLFEFIQLQPMVQCGGPSHRDYVFEDCGYPV